MQPIFYVMAILGCGDGSVDCTEARMVPARYETMAQCRADLANRIAANTDVPYPVIGADCRRIGAQVAKAERKPSQGTRPISQERNRRVLFCSVELWEFEGRFVGFCS